MKFWAIFIDTLREARDKRMFLVFGIITLLFVVGYVSLFKVEKIDDQSVSVGLVFEDKMAKTVEARDFVIENMMFFLIFNSSVLTFLFIIVFAFFIPNLLQPGNLDIHLSKPIRRPMLLLYKFFACVLATFLLFFAITVVMWSVLCLKAGAWPLRPFLFVSLFPVVFAIAFSIIVCCSVLTRGAGTGIAVYLIYAFVIQGVLQARDQFKALLPQGWFAEAIDFLYHISPKISESLDIIGRYTMEREITSWFPLWSSAIAGAALLILSCIVFSYRDY